ncbi:tetratricopeptide (TPR) repeat protein [Pedobacter africanus]|uniref:Tetratricopeptide (TPR) repeat protein n=1 Tax=Pedobacter africanus TaxID=151894 RepID=A0ACC6KSL8_9SPHI|nr:RagB/SusD family nutrient uptake outer membrane protein [Pedobacter africanus]MDR6782202.1 tetratricopeptide (TPR) repeat protein [Pedobacter africanus]
MSYYKNIINIISIAILTISLSSCKKDFLEVVPKGVAIATKTSDYERLLNDLNLNSIASVSQIVMSDELAGFAPLYSPGTGVLNIADQKAFEYQDDIYLPTENTSELTQLEKQLYTYNKVINEVMESKEGNDAQKKSLRAEALAGRAWVHFMLVNYYGKPYNAVTAASDPGIPLIKIADVTQTTFTRVSVQAAYDLIIADLTEAISDLPARIISRHRMSRAAAEAILGKVYVYMQQFDKALPLFTSCLANLSNASVSVGLYDFNGAFSTGGVFFPVNPFTGPNRTNMQIDQEVLYLKMFINFYSYFFSGIPISRQTAELYTTTDLRLNFFTASPFPPTGATYPNKMMRCYGKYANMGINVPDVYLLKAECESRRGDLTNAVNDLVALRRTRMNKNVANAADVPANIASDKVALTKYILEERIREFATTGERWWDMRRLSVDDTYKSTVGMVHHMYDATGNIVKSYPLRPERLTFRFPQYIINANPGLQQNP